MNFRAKTPWFSLAVCILFCLPCSANILVNNGSFEAPVFSSSGFVMPTGWTLVTGSAVISGNAGGLSAVDGNQQVLLGNSGTFQEISQSIGTLSANTTYELTFFAGWRNDDPNSPLVSRVATIALTQGANTLLLVTKTFNAGAGDTLGTYYKETGAFSTGATPNVATPVVLRVESSSGVSGIQGWFDDVQVVSTPEPGSVWLAALGIGMLLMSAKLRAS